VTFKIASGRLDWHHRLSLTFADRATNVAFVAVPVPHITRLSLFFDVNRIPDTPFGVIVLMDFLTVIGNLPFESP